MAYPDTFFYDEFRSTTYLLAQRSGGVLTPFVKVKTGVRGVAARMANQIGTIDPISPDVRGGPMGAIMPSVDAPWVFPDFFEIPLVLDHPDRLQEINDPKAGFQEAMAEGMGRKMDDVTFLAFFGDRVTGERRETTTTFAAGGGRSILANVGGGGSDVGMNGLKVLEAKKNFGLDNVRTEGRKFAMALGPQQVFELLQDPWVSASMWSDKKRMEKGVIGEWMGVTFLEFNACSKTGNNRECPIWDCEKAVELDIWEDGRTWSGPRTDRSGLPEMLYQSGYFGSGRLETVRVQKVLCKE